MQVIPAINAESFYEVEKRVKLVEPYVEWVQLDVSDNTFGEAKNWNNPSDLKNFETSVKMEVHLMMDNIEEKIGSWFDSSIQRIIFHLETIRDPYALVDRIKKSGKEIGIAIAPDTPVEKLFSFCPSAGSGQAADLFQILAVSPGPSGQEFQEKSLQKIKDLRKNCPDAIIEVDGGVNLEVAKKVKAAGADIISAASYIFNSNPPAGGIKKTIEQLCQI